MKMLDWAGDLFRWAAGAVVPMFARPVPPVGLAWFVHVLLAAAVAIGFYYAQPHLGITVNVGRGPPWFRPFWLPALFLLGYALIWSAVWLWHSLAPNQPATDFPDLDTAWDGVLASLEKAGIGIADTPLFLVFGDLPAGHDPLFRALPHGLAVAGGTSPGDPLRVYANRDSIFLTLPGATLLGVQKDGTGSLGPAEEGGGSIYQSVGLNASIGIGQSVGISVAGSIGGGEGPLQEIQRIIRRAKDENRPMTDAEQRRVRELSGSNPDSPEPGGRGPSSGAVLQNPRLVEVAAARLKHVCGRIAAARWPLCPINGAILTVPITAADRDDTAQQWGLVARQDLAVAEAGLKLRFPVYALVGGIEELPGGPTFFERFAADKGGQRLGKGFPLNPEVRPTDAATSVEASVGWVFSGLLPYWTFKLMRVDGHDTRADTRDNAGLVRFLAEIRRRGPSIARLVSRAVAHGDRLPVFGGCYLTVVLPGDPGEAKFAKEFFRKVESTQGYVAWTDEAFADDASYRALTKVGYGVLAVVLGGVFAFAAYVGFVKWGR